MRPDQIARLQQLEEKLADIFLDEADPDGWEDDRTERYKRKRDAAETAMLLARTQTLMAAKDDSNRHDPENEKARANLIEQAEKRAAAAIEKAHARAKRAA